MMNFTFRKSYEDSPDENLLHTRKLRLKRWIFSILFFLFISSVIIYTVYRIKVKIFDGYLIVHSSDIRLVEDVFLVRNRVNSGDFVQVGDTLFSYVLTGFYVDAANLAQNNFLQTELNRFKFESQRLRAEQRITNNKIDSLQKIVKKLERDVAMGIETINAVEVKKWELFIAQSELKRLVELSEITSEAYNETANRLSGLNEYYSLQPPMLSAEFLANNEHIFGTSLVYSVATDDLVVLDAPMREGALVYKKEAVMNVLYVGEKNLADIHVLAFISSDFLAEIKDNTEVQVFLGNTYLTNGKVSLDVSRMYGVDPEKLGVMTQTGEAVAIRVNLEENTSIDRKYQINNLPIKVRYKRNFLRNKIS